jgi:predicted nucleic acid-binding protein
VSAGADYIITGNARHFPDRFESIRMVTPKEFLDLIAPEFTKDR